jgi:hypothetical protein
MIQQHEGGNLAPDSRRMYMRVMARPAAKKMAKPTVVHLTTGA